MTYNDLTVIELTEENIESMVYDIRGQKVMLDFDLARIYGYETKRFNEQVKNNIEKFPEDFMFQLTNEELETILKSKKMMISEKESLWSKKSALNKSGNLRGKHFKYLPYVFTEQGIYMLMTVLRGELAVKQSKALIRLFKKMKDFIVESNNLLTTRDILDLSNQVHKNAKSIESLKRNNAGINKKLTKVMDYFIDPSTYKHFLILNGERIEGDFAYQTIYSLAKQSIYIIDDYIDVKTLQLLKVVGKDIEIVIFSNNKAKSKLTKSFVEDFIKDTGLSLSLRTNNGLFHDRYIIIDYKQDNESIYHCGASSKDVGKGITTIETLEQKELYRPLIEQLLLCHNLELI